MLSSFTSVFGMGTGGSYSLIPPGDNLLFNWSRQRPIYKFTFLFLIKQYLNNTDLDEYMLKRRSAYIAFTGVFCPKYIAMSPSFFLTVTIPNASLDTKHTSLNRFELTLLNLIRNNRQMKELAKWQQQALYKYPK